MMTILIDPLVGTLILAAALHLILTLTYLLMVAKNRHYRTLGPSLQEPSARITPHHIPCSAVQKSKREDQTDSWLLYTVATEDSFQLRSCLKSALKTCHSQDTLAVAFEGTNLEQLQSFERTISQAMLSWRRRHLRDLRIELSDLAPSLVEPQRLQLLQLLRKFVILPWKQVEHILFIGLILAENDAVARRISRVWRQVCPIQVLPTARMIRADLPTHDFLLSLSGQYALWLSFNDHHTWIAHHTIDDLRNAYQELQDQWGLPLERKLILIEKAEFLLPLPIEEPLGARSLRRMRRWARANPIVNCLQAQRYQSLQESKDLGNQFYQPYGADSGGDSAPLSMWPDPPLRPHRSDLISPLTVLRLRPEFLSSIEIPRQGSKPMPGVGLGRNLDQCQLLLSATTIQMQLPRIGGTNKALSDLLNFWEGQTKNHLRQWKNFLFSSTVMAILGRRRFGGLLRESHLGCLVAQWLNWLAPLISATITTLTALYLLRGDFSFEAAVGPLCLSSLMAEWVRRAILPISHMESQTPWLRVPVELVLFPAAFRALLPFWRQAPARKRLLKHSPFADLLPSITAFYTAHTLLLSAGLVAASLHLFKGSPSLFPWMTAATLGIYVACYFTGYHLLLCRNHSDPNQEKSARHWRRRSKRSSFSETDTGHFTLHPSRHR